MEAIDICTDLLYNDKHEPPPVDNETFKNLAPISSCNVYMLSHNGYYKQKDGSAMGSPLASHLANRWLSKYDPDISWGAKIYYGYMDDILRDMKSQLIESKLAESNNLHLSLDFTHERQNNGQIAFLAMKIINNNGSNGNWYWKPTDTWLIMNLSNTGTEKIKMIGGVKIRT